MHWTIARDRRKDGLLKPTADRNDPYIKYRDSKVYRVALEESVLDGISFSYFFTGTFKREPQNLDKAIRIGGKYFDTYKDKCNKEGEGFWYFLTAERGGKHGRPHLHGLIGTTEPRDHTAKTNSYHDLWFKCFQRFGRCKIEKIRSSAGVKSYCTKYIAKYGDPDVVDFDLGDHTKREHFKTQPVFFGFNLGGE